MFNSSPLKNPFLFKNKILLINLLLIFLAFIFLIFSFKFSYTSINFSNVFLGKENLDYILFFQIKLPSYLIIYFSGFGLGVLGCLLQGFFKNPLADPGILGLSAGASFFGILVIFFLGTSITLASFNQVLLFFIASSFIGVIIVMLVIFIISNFLKSQKLVAIILIGVALSALFSSFSLLVFNFADSNTLKKLFSWSTGGFINISYLALTLLFCANIFVLLFSFNFSKYLDFLSLGETIAYSMGVNINKLLVYIMICSGILISIITATCGPIGFIGLIAPHIMRFLCQSKHKVLIFQSGLLGGLLLLISFYISNEILYPQVISLGIITSILGVPFFLFILIIKLKD